MTPADHPDRRPLSADPRVLETTVLAARARRLPPWSGYEALRDIARAERASPRPAGYRAVMHDGGRSGGDGAPPLPRA